MVKIEHLQRIDKESAGWVADLRASVDSYAPADKTQAPIGLHSLCVERFTAALQLDGRAVQEVADYVVMFSEAVLGCKGTQWNEAQAKALIQFFNEGGADNIEQIVTSIQSVLEMREEEMEVSEKPLDAEKFRGWANGVNKKLKELELDLVPRSEHVIAQIDAELAALYTQYANVNGDMSDAARKQIEVKAILGITTEEMADIESDAFLDVCSEYNEKGKAKYTNPDMRKAAVRLRLKDNSEYQVLLAQKREQESESLNLRIVMEQTERMLKEYGRRNAALVARLEALTAQVAR